MKRKERGLSQAGLADLIAYSPTLVGQVETCDRIPQPDFIEAVERTLDAGGVLALAAEHLAMDRYPLFFADFAKLEAEALAVESYSNTVLNGLLQTDEYARAVIDARIPPHEVEEVDRLVSARMDRQALFDRKPGAMLSFVIEERVLKRQVIGADGMRGQLRKLLEIGGLRHVSLQVMPTSKALHAGLDGSMT